MWNVRKISRPAAWVAAVALGGCSEANISFVDIPAEVALVRANTAPVAANDTASTLKNVSVSINVLLNDSDANSDSLSISNPGSPAHGTVSVTSDQKILYVPTTGYFGTDSFTYTVSDGFGGTASASVQVFVNDPANTSPVAVTDTASTAEDVAGVFSVLGNDTDADADALSINTVSAASHGTTSITGTTITYTPTANYNGADSFTYTIIDGRGGNATGTVNVTVTPVNDAPAGTGQSVTLNEDATAAITLSGTDIDGNALTYSVGTNPSHGTLTGTAPNLTYTPTANYNGADSFTFIANDGTVNSAAATVSLTVNAINDAPTATAGAVSGAEDSAISITLAGNDADGNALTFSVVTSPASGVISGTSPNLTYTPTANFNGADSLVFRAHDGSTFSANATISITVTPVNDAPVATAQTVNVTEDVASAITLAGSDAEGSALTYTVVTGPTHGSLTGTAPNLTFTPTANYNGSDSFTFKVNDGTIDSAAAATVTINVSAVNDAPVASDGSDSTNEDTAKAITVSASDTEGNALTYSIVSAPAQGSLSGSGPGYTYTPAANYNGTVTFTFKANDGSSDSNTATLTMTVNAVNDAPVATAQSVSTDEDVAKAITLSGTDIEGTALTYSHGNPASGTLSGTAPNLTYTPNANFNGSDSFTFTVSDGALTSTAATISITVNPVNDAPTTAAGSDTTAEDTPKAVSVSGSDTEGNALTYTIVSGPTNGALSGSGPSFTYTPTANYNGADSFTFKANDGSTDSNTSTFSLTVTAVNDTPVANAQSVGVTKNVATAITLAGSDVEGSALTYSHGSPTNGVLTGTAPNLTYTPNNNYVGTDSFTFTVNDGALTSAAATVSITVVNSNTLPVANAGSDTTAEDTAKALTLSATDVDGNALTYSVVANPTHGVLSGTPPNVTYTPTANYNGADSFTFKANDGVGDSNTATFSLTVTAVNDAPVATAQSVSTAEDTATAVTLAGSDVEGSALTYTVVSGPAHGALSGTAPNLTFTPTADYNGSDSFTFKVNDGTADSAATATVSLTVTAANDAPVASAGSDSTAEDAAKALTLSASDTEGSTLTYTIVTSPTHGALSGTPPNVTYTPTANYNGADSFTFKANDGSADSNTATFSLTVTAVNDAPAATAQSVTTNEDTAKAITLAGTDVEGSALTYAIVSGPTSGALSGTAPNITYTPNSNFNGSDSFTFKVNDGAVDSSAVTVSITVTAVNDAPVATAGSDTTNEDVAKSVSVTATDPEGNALTYTVVSSPTHGTLTGSGPSFTYTPTANYNGADSFTFKANDGSSDSNTVTFGLTVTAVQDAPTATGGSDTGSEDTPKAISVTAADVDGDTLTYTIVSGPSSGALTGTGPGFTYTPAANFNGSDSFTFKANDGSADSNTATFNLTVTAVNDAPVATPQGSVSLAEDGSQAITLAGTDAEGSALTFAVVTNPTHGALTGTAPNLTYTPTANYNGSDSFSFKANDGALDSGNATVSITVTAVNDTPTATSASVGVSKNTATAITLSGSDIDGNALTYTVVASPGHGALTGTAPNLTFTPTTNYVGNDSFTFKVNDGTVDSSTATISITVNAVNSNPVASADSATVAENTPKDISVLANDSDVDGDTLSISAVGSASNGTTSIVGTTVRYSPSPGYDGSDSFTYTLSDGVGGSATGTVSVTVIPDSGARSLTLAGATTGTTSQCLMYTVTAKDGDGYTIGVGAATTINLTTTGTGTFYSNSGCSSSVTSVVLSVGESAKTFYYSPTAAGSHVLSVAHSAGLLTGSSVTLSAQSNQFTLSGPVSGTAGACIGPFPLVYRNSAGTAINAPAGGITTTITVLGAYGVPNTASNCSNGSKILAPITFAAGTSTLNLYFDAYNYGSSTISASATNVASASHDFSVSAGAASKWVIVGPAAVTTNVCTPFELSSKDAGNYLAAINSNITVTLSGSGTGAFYSDSTCTTTTTTVAAASGTHTSLFYFRDATSESLTFGATGTLATAGSLAVTVSPPPDKLVLEGPVSQYAGACSLKYTIRTVDGTTGTQKLVSSPITVNLSTSGAGSYYAEPNCSGAVIQATTIPSGRAIKNVYYKAAAAETPTLTAAASGMTSGTYSARVTSAVEVGKITGMHRHYCALLTDHTVKCWGLNANGQLGNNSTTNASTPVLVSGLTNVIDISAGEFHTCAVVGDGTVKCWGLNTNGRIGDGTSTQRLVPTAVSNVTGALEISSGGAHSCALLSDRTMTCWGKGFWGQLGHGVDADSLTAVAVRNVSGVVQMGTGSEHTCALLFSGNVQCWGYNVDGELGYGGSVQFSISPFTVSNVNSATSMAVGNFHNCVVLADKTVKCWAQNFYGELGDSTTTGKLAPVVTTGLANVRMLSAGGITLASYYSSTCAMLTDDTAKCWGYNANSQLGDDTITNRSTAVVVTDISAASTIHATTNATCVLLKNGTAKCWGSNIYGQLGDGSTTASANPVNVLLP